MQLALCLGVVIAVIVWRTGRPALLARGSDQAIAVFVAGVLLVSLLLVFGIRAVTLYVYRRFVVT